ncbi:hypothetical protein [Streptomyces sp. NPDC005302]|uniref:hypothetical protein n=1 Tax=Streptomyces sp. NPDC005302 TaxID=3154675 RepID=UPI0033B82C5E
MLGDALARQQSATGDPIPRNTPLLGRKERTPSGVAAGRRTERLVVRVGVQVVVRVVEVDGVLVQAAVLELEVVVLDMTVVPVRVVG